MASLEVDTIGIGSVLVSLSGLMAVKSLSTGAGRDRHYLYRPPG